MESMCCLEYDFLCSCAGMRRYSGDTSSDNCNGARRKGRPSLVFDNLFAILVVRRYRL